MKKIKLLKVKVGVLGVAESSWEQETEPFGVREIKNSSIRKCPNLLIRHLPTRPFARAHPEPICDLAAQLLA